MKITRFILIALMWLLLPLMSNAGGVSEKQSTGNQREIGAAAEREEPRLERHGSGLSKPPKTPRSPRAEAVSPFQIILTWSDHSDNEAGFKIERSTDGRSFFQIAQVLPNTTNYRDTSRFPGTKYHYRVRAYNPTGASAFSKVVHARTPVSSCVLSIAALHGYGQYLLPDGSSHWVAIAAGRDHGLALRSDRTVAGWSIGFSNDAAQIPPGLKNVVAIAAGGEHSLALRSDGTVTGWGSNEDGVSVPPPELSGVVAIAAGYRHSLALKSDGTVVGWGDNWQGAATPPADLVGVVAIAAGDSFSLALRSDGTVVGWGYNANDQAIPPADLTNVIAIAASDAHSLALKSDGTVVSWGDERLHTTIPPPSPALTEIAAIADGIGGSAALKRDGTVIIWGEVLSWSWAATFQGVVAISAKDSHLVILSTTPNQLLSIRATVISSNRVHLAWSDDSASRNSFNIERALESATYGVGDWFLIGQTVKGTTNFDDTTVKVGATYLYRVSVFNGCHVSEPSSSGFVTVSAPTNPPSLQGRVFADQARLTGESDRSGATGYVIERASDVSGSPEQWSVLLTTNFPPPIPFFEYADGGLSVNHIYWYRLRAFNALGMSPFSSPVRIEIFPPRRPYSPSAYIDISNGIKLNWSASYPYDHEGFIIERSTNAPAVEESWRALARVTNMPDSGDYSDIDVKVNATYRYRVRAFNVLGVSLPSDEATVTVTPPTAPLLSGWAVANTAGLDWYHANYSGGTERFKIERAIDVNGAPGVWKTIADVHEANQSSFTDLNLTPDNAYWYRVKTFNWAGESLFSEPVRVEIVPPQPPYITGALMGRSNVVTLSWTAWFVNALEGIRVERARDVGGTAGSWTEIGKVFTASSLGGEFEDTNAAPNSTHWYRMRTFNGAGLSAYGEPLKFDVVPPLQPVLSARQSTTNITLFFNGIEFGVMGFKLESAPDSDGEPGQWAQIATVAPRSFSDSHAFGVVTDSNLPPLVMFWYRVRAFNWAGDSEYSGAESVAILPPEAPYSLSAKIGQSNRVDLAWLAGNNSSGHKVERALNAGGVPGTWVELNGLTFTNWSGGGAVDAMTRASDADIMRRNTYSYRVRGVNLAGHSGYSPVVSVDIAPPPAPYSPSASAFADRVALSWDSNFGDYGHVDGFEVERAIETPGTPLGWSQIKTVPLYYNPAIDSGLLAGASYWYRVRSVNWVGASGYSEPVSVTIAPPESPYNLSSKIGNKTVKLFWWTGSSLDQDGFIVERTANTNDDSVLWTAIGNFSSFQTYQASFTDTNVTAFTTNWYRVRAYNIVGVSTASSPVEVQITPPYAVRNLVATPFANTVRLGWYEDYDLDYGHVDGFKIERAPDFGGTPGDWTEIATSTLTLNDGVYFYVDANLPVHTTWWYRIQSFNWVGVSPYCDPVGVTIAEPPSLSSIAPPPATFAGFRITSLILTNDSALITWSANANTTNFVESATELENGFVEVSPPIVIQGETGTFLHPGALTNSSSRYYRIRLVP